MNNMNTIPGPSSHMNTTNGRTMNTLPVTGDQEGRLFMKPIPRHRILRDKDEVDIIFHSHFSRIHSSISFTQRAEVGSRETQDL